MFKKSEEQQQRIDIVQEMLLSGLRRSDIIRTVNETPSLTWGVGDRTIDGYVRKAQIQITKQFEKNRDRMIPDIYTKYDHLYRKMMMIKDYRGAMAALDRMTEFIHLLERMGNKTTLTEAELQNMRPTQVMFVVNKPKEISESKQPEDIEFQESN